MRRGLPSCYLGNILKLERFQSMLNQIDEAMLIQLIQWHLRLTLCLDYDRKESRLKDPLPLRLIDCST